MTNQPPNDDVLPPDGGDLHREFLALYSASAGRLYSYISCLLTHAADADEAFQEVSYLLWTKFDQFNREKEFLSWAIGIAHFVVMQQRRKTKRRLLMDEATLELVAAEASNRLGQARDQRHALSHCIEKLSAADRHVLRLRYEMQLKPKEIGPHLGRSVHVVYRTLARIHQLLLECIQRNLREAQR